LISFFHHITLTELNIPILRLVEESMKIVGHVPARELLKGFDAVKELLSLGIGVELQLTSQVLDSFTYKDFGALAQLLEGALVTIHAPFLNLDPGASEPLVLEATRKRFFQTISVAKLLEPEVVVFHTGYHPDRVKPIYDSWFKRALESFLQVAGAYSGRVALENVFDSNPENLERFLRELPKSFGVCIDVGHLNLFSELPVSDWLESFKDRIYEFHVHDNNGLEDQHAPVGTGTFDFSAFFSSLRVVTSDYIFNLENKTPEAVKESLSNLRRYWWKEKLGYTQTQS